MNILILNGVNLNMLGVREPDIYGSNSYLDLENFIETIEVEASIKMNQTNNEYEFIEWIHDTSADALILNPGAWTHYSYAIRDAIASKGLPFVEVHLTDVQNREEFRKISVIKDLAVTTISGKGFDGYKEAVEILVKK